MVLTMPIPFKLAVLCATDDKVKRIVEGYLGARDMLDTNYKERPHGFLWYKKYRAYLNLWRQHPLLDEFEPTEVSNDPQV